MRVGVLLFADLLVLAADYSAVDLVRSSSQTFSNFLLELFPRGTLPRVEVLIAVIFGLTLFRNYGPGPYRQNGSRLFSGAALGLSLVFWSRIWQGISPLGAIGFLLAIVALGLTLRAGRVVVQFAVAAVRPPLPGTARAVVIGSASRAAQLRQSPLLVNPTRLSILGFIPPDGDDPSSMGPLGDLVWILDRYAINTVMIAEQLDDDVLIDVLKICDDTGCTAIAASPLCPVGGFIPRVAMLGHQPYVELYRPSLRAPQLAVKRLFDVVFGALFLVLSIPILAVAALAIALTSRGAVIFSQDRIGYGGRRFRMYKLRTMVDDAEEKRAGLRSASLYSDDRVFKVRNDPRVTTVGRILRRTSIDELPQLWNVLRGEMSLVGPRPPLPNEVDLYEESHYSRFDMKPGITGPWQVAGRTNVTRFEEIVLLDAANLTDWTIWKDFVLMVKTVPAVLTMRGAV
jgi:exopolysaccharide biosynthesis polyprenyl glycosylphosphotransferase